MQTKTAMVVLAMVVVGAAGWFFYSNRGNTVNTPALQEQFEWSFVDRGVDASISAPKTAVNLRIAGVDVPLGTYTGTCFEIEGSSWKLLETQVSGAICWWAGGGVELGVFDEGGKLVLKSGDIEEGTAEGAAFRGNFRPFVQAE